MQGSVCNSAPTKIVNGFIQSSIVSDLRNLKIHERTTVARGNVIQTAAICITQVMKRIWQNNQQYYFVPFLQIARKDFLHWKNAVGKKQYPKAKAIPNNSPYLDNDTKGAAVQ